jgi:hypothetical protein
MLSRVAGRAGRRAEAPVLDHLANGTDAPTRIDERVDAMLGQQCRTARRR